MVADIEQTFRRLKEVNMKLNPAKCSFGMKHGKFLGHMISDNNIKETPTKVSAINQMKSPQTLKELQCLNGRLAALNRFVLKLAKRQLPFFRTLKSCTKKKNFQWSVEAEEYFTELKEVSVTSRPSPYQI
jgi:hypothetical protein